MKQLVAFSLPLSGSVDHLAGSAKSVSLSD